MSGARLIPSVCPKTAPDGERAIFNMLRNDPGADGWVVLHSLDMVQHVINVMGEADFVILIPNEGIVVLEVKSHHTVRYDGHGWWLGNAPDPDLRGPFKQASEIMHSIHNEVKQMGSDFCHIPLISAVSFTSFNFTVTSPEWHAWQVINKNTLDSFPISQNFLTVIRSARAHFATRGLRWVNSHVLFGVEQVQQVADRLRPSFECMASFATVRKEQEDGLLRCTEQQYGALGRLAANERLFIQGPAGTGKTCLALEAIRRDTVTRPEGRRALFCFNRNLGGYLQLYCKGRNVACVANSFHSWQREYAGIHIPDKPTPDFWHNTLPDAVADKIRRKGEPLFDYIVVDEAQDLFSEKDLMLFNLMLTGGLDSGRWAFFADFANQNFQNVGQMITVKDFHSKWARYGFVDYLLDVNCRNTLEISQYISLLAHPTPAYSATLRPDTHHDPELIFYSSPEEQLDRIDGALDRLLGEGFKDADIVILSPVADKPCAKLLGETKRWKSRIKPYGSATSGIRYCTVHAFKGLEAPVVILTDIQGLDSTLQKPIFYVGLSRALHRLFVLVHESAKGDIRKALGV